MTKRSASDLREAWDATIPKDRVLREPTAFLGLSSKGLIVPGATLSIEAWPQLAFRPMLFFVDPSCAGKFDITGIRIGNMEKFADYGSIPASAFALRMIGDEVITPGVRIVDWETIVPGQRISVMVLNLHDEPLRFRSGLEGHCRTL